MGWRGPVTNRQLRAWTAWRVEVDFYTPDKQTIYAAQIAYEVAGILPDYIAASVKDSQVRRPEFSRFLLQRDRVGSQGSIRRDQWGNELTERGIPKIEVSEGTFKRWQAKVEQAKWSVDRGLRPEERQRQGKRQG